jgi:hypothetical protein
VAINGGWQRTVRFRTIFLGSAAGRNAITTERASMSRRIIASYVNEFYSGEGEGLVNIDVIVQRNANVEFGYSLARYPRSY